MVYTLIYNGSGIQRDSDNAFIPDDPNNSDWQIYQKWLSSGNTPNAAVIPSPQPISVPMWAAKYQMGITPFTPSQAQSTYQSTVSGQTTLLGAFNTLLPTLNNPELTAYWDNGTQIISNDSTLLTLASYLGLTSSQVLSLCQSAASLSL